MIEIKANIWKFVESYAVCITTNGTVKKNGEAVMGAGLALQSTKIYPQLPKILGQKIQDHGNFVLKLLDSYKLFSFPVKHQWWETANIELIRKSAEQLTWLTTDEERVYLPRVGCGNGGLIWPIVRPVLEEILTDKKFIICDYKTGD